MYIVIAIVMNKWMEKKETKQNKTKQKNMKDKKSETTQKE